MTLLKGAVNGIPVLNQGKKIKILGGLFLAGLLAGSFGVYLCVCVYWAFFTVNKPFKGKKHFQEIRLP